MKVTVIYDFTVEEIEDFSNDKVKIEMSFKEFKEIRQLLNEVWIERTGSVVGWKARLLARKLQNYKTKSKM